MDKLTKSQEDVVRKFLSRSNSAEFTQEILRIIGEENWTRRLLNDTFKSHLTVEQKIIFKSLGGGYSAEDVSEHLRDWNIEDAISEELKERGVSSYLYKNEDYLSALRNGQEIFEGLDVAQIKNDLLME